MASVLVYAVASSIAISYGSEVSLGYNKCLNHQGWCQCPGQSALTALFRSSCELLECIDNMRCADLAGGATRTGCMTVDTVWDSTEWLSCPANTFITGIYRGTCNSLNCIDKLECCTFDVPSNTRVVTGTEDWMTCFDNRAWCVIPPDSFISGFYRSSCSSIRCLEKVSVGRFIDPSQAPPTLAPPTPAPRTPFPSTSAPATPAPFTPSPSTITPDTSSPDTSAPWTTVPSTSAPLTLHPVTLPLTTAPITASPSMPSVLPASVEPVASPNAVQSTPPAPVQTSVGMDTAGSIASGASLLGNPGAAAAASRLVLIKEGCHDAATRFPPPLHPTRFTVQSSEAAGAVLGNIGIVVAMTALWTAVAYAATYAAPQWFEGIDLLGWLRLPTVPLVLIQTLYQGTALGAVELVIHPESVGQWMLGAVALVMCSCVPVAVFVVTVHGVPEKARLAFDTQCSGVVRGFLLGNGEWVSLRKTHHWVNRYTSVIRPWRQEVAWFSTVEFVSMLALAFIGSVRADTSVECGHIKGSMALVSSATGFAEGLMWPHAKQRDSAFDFITLSLQAMGLFLMAIGYYCGVSSSHSLFSTSQDILFAAIVVVLIRVGFDIISEVYVLVTGRRKRLQNLEWNKVPFFVTPLLLLPFPEPTAPSAQAEDGDALDRFVL